VSPPGAAAQPARVDVIDGTAKPDVKGTGAAPAMPAKSAAPPDPAVTAARTGADGVHLHDGFYFRAAVGASFLASSSVSSSTLSQDISVSGTGAGLELSAGTTVGRGIVVGGGIYGHSVSSPSYSMTGASATGGSLTATGIGPFVDWYPNPASGWHAEGVIGLGFIKASKGNQFPTQDYSGTGVLLSAGGGYEWWLGEQLSLGVLARLQYAQADVKADGSTQSATMKLFTPALLASLTYQ
jgi:hypothetical protein